MNLAAGTQMTGASPVSNDSKDNDAARFSAVIEAYGADPARWPDADLALMHRFQTRNPAAAQAMLEEARRLDACLDAAASPPPGQALKAEIFERLEAEQAARPARPQGATPARTRA